MAAHRRARRDVIGSSGGASESSAPALARLSSTRLFTRRRSACSHSVRRESIRPPRSVRTARIDRIAPSPTFLTAVRPKRTPSGSTVNGN